MKKFQLVGHSLPMIKLRSQIAALRGREASVILTGESGVGKEVVARILNYQDGLARPFVGVNCGAIPGELLESELFGHEKGSFTGATQKKVGKFFQAVGGTIFLDEIGDLPLSMQVKLLRVLQERTLSPVGSTKVIPIQVRIIAATNKDLVQAVREGSFREDLYYRLSVIPIHIPPLRERPDDIEPLVRYFLEEFGASTIRLPVETIHHLKRHRWPGNIRALKNCIERALILLQGSDSYSLQPEHMVFDEVTAEKGQSLVVPKRLLPQTSDDLSSESLQAYTEWAEQIYFDHAYLAAQRNKTRLAEKLSVSRNFLHGKLKALGIGLSSGIEPSEVEVSS